MNHPNAAKTVRLDVSIWYNKDDEQIRVSSREGNGFISTVSADPKSQRVHRHLFYKLAKILKEAGAMHPDIPDRYEDF